MITLSIGMTRLGTVFVAAPDATVAESSARDYAEIKGIKATGFPMAKVTHFPSNAFVVNAVS
jgi:hypothetical protein